MAWITSVIAGVVLVTVMTVMTGPGGAQATSDIEPERMMVAHGSPEQVDLVDLMTRRFEIAGLLLPSFTVTFHQDPGTCGGLGHHQWARSQSSIDVCVVPDDDLVLQQHVVGHELAHAWAESTLDEDARRDFLALRGLTSWNDATTPWELRGSEHAAEVVTWAVLGFSSVPLQIPDASCNSLQTAYFRLTSRLPSHTECDDL